jgi:hypothetical protein
MGCCRSTSSSVLRGDPPRFQERVIFEVEPSIIRERMNQFYIDMVFIGPHPSSSNCLSLGVVDQLATIGGGETFRPPIPPPGVAGRHLVVTVGDDLSERSGVVRSHARPNYCKHCGFANSSFGCQT